MQFEWDTVKNRQNVKKHGISFDAAVKVFYDESRLEIYDENHSEYEDRFITIGLIDGKVIILYVCYTTRKDAIRIISARKATKEERKNYYDSKKKN